jgi:NAD(P)-dependent dehydrogenase (short-subunit alcohol dehydrogenase family)
MKRDLFDVSSEIAVVTGVAGQLGSEYARMLASRGCGVVGIDVTRSARSEGLIEEFADRYAFIEADVRRREALENVLTQTRQKFGVPSVLINNAAIDSPPSAPPAENGPYEDYPESSWDKIMEVNLKGVHLCCQVFGGAMAIAGRGSIINIASIYGLVAPDQALYEYRRQRGEVFYKPVAYSASKSAIMNLTRYLAAYWGKRNVRVNTLSIAGVFNGQEKQFIDGYCARMPIGRMAESDEYNGAVLFLASDASKYMTGHNLVVDGGWTAI